MAGIPSQSTLGLEGFFQIAGRKPGFKRAAQTGSTNVPGGFLSQATGFLKCEFQRSLKLLAAQMEQADGMSVGTLSWQPSPPGCWSRDRAAVATAGRWWRCRTALFPSTRRWEGKQRQGGCPGTPPEPGTPRDHRRGTPGWATTRWQPEPGDEAVPARSGPSSVSGAGRRSCHRTDITGFVPGENAICNGDCDVKCTLTIGNFLLHPPKRLRADTIQSWQALLHQPAQLRGLTQAQLLWRSLLNVPHQHRDTQLCCKKPSSATGSEPRAGSPAAPDPTLRTVSSSFCLFSLAACSSFICRSSSSCSASSFWRSSFRFSRASLCGGGLPARSRLTVLWMAAETGKSRFGSEMDFVGPMCHPEQRHCFGIIQD
ncbi:hypothetical protein DV515_00011898, partial [Chloebia gouldiae]